MEKSLEYYLHVFLSYSFSDVGWSGGGGKALRACSGWTFGFTSQSTVGWRVWDPIPEMVVAESPHFLSLVFEKMILMRCYSHTIKFTLSNVQFSTFNTIFYNCPISRMFASSPENKSCPHKQSTHCPFSLTPGPHLPAFEPLAASAPRSPGLPRVLCDAS